MEFKYSSNYGSMAELFREYADFKEEPLEDIMYDRAKKLMSSDFGDGTIGLFQAGAKIAPTAQELFGLPQKLGWRIKRKGRPVFTLYELRAAKRGKTKGQVKEFRRKNKATGKKILIGEIERRMNARLTHASGWLNPNFATMKKKNGTPSTVKLTLEGDVLKISITNNTNAAQKIVDEHGNYVEEVLALQVADMLRYIERKIEEKNSKFNKRRI